MFWSAPTEPPKPSASVATLPIFAFRLRHPVRIVLVQDVGGGEHVDVRPRRIAIVGTENIEDPSAPADAASQGVIRASIAVQSDQTKLFPGPAMSAGRTSRASLRAAGTSTGSAATSSAIAAAIGDHIDQRRFRGAVLAEHVAGEILDLRALAT